jgi:hypothetical protein
VFLSVVGLLSNSEAMVATPLNLEKESINKCNVYQSLHYFSGTLSLEGVAPVILVSLSNR